jgi:hypothetical protein
MKELLEAFQIFAKYTDEKHPTHCEHDLLHVCVDPSKVSNEDVTRLSELGFNNDGEHFYSYKFGSC